MTADDEVPEVPDPPAPRICLECDKPLPADWPFTTCGSHDPERKDLPYGRE